MIFEGTVEVRKPRESLWQFIIDPARVGKCFPGLKSLEVESEERSTATISVGVGPLKSDFKFRIQISEKEPTNHVRLRAVGSGSGSNVDLDVAIELKETSEGTALSYKAEAKVGGMIASFGQRVIEDTAGRTVAQVFECIKNQLE